MMRKNLIVRDWSSMHDCEKSYLRAAYERYLIFAKTSEKPCFHKDCFSEWLSKRGIHKSLTEREEKLH